VANDGLGILHGDLNGRWNASVYWKQVQNMGELMKQSQHAGGDSGPWESSDAQGFGGLEISLLTKRPDNSDASTISEESAVGVQCD
jgi:hypothetical protein